MTPALFYLLLGVVLVAIELVVMSFAVVWLFIFGISALVTSIVAWIFPQLDWTLTTLIFLLSSVISVLLIYKPLSRWQSTPSSIPGHDAIGQTGEVISDITCDSSGTMLWSGSEWEAELIEGEQEPLCKGSKAIIIKLEGIRLIVGHDRD